MYRNKLNYPCAIADQTPEGMEAALDWLLDRSKKDEELTLWVPQRSTLGNNAFLRDLAKCEGRGLRIVARGEIGIAHGPVLAMYPSVEQLALVTAATGITALAVVQWADQLETWSEEVEAEVVYQSESSDVLSAYTHRSERKLAPEVIEGLRYITGIINHNNTIAGSGYNKDRTVETLLQLHDSGIQLPPKKMAQWVIAHGWRGNNPKELIQLINDINSGKRPRTST